MIRKFLLRNLLKFVGITLIFVAATFIIFVILNPFEDTFTTSAFQVIDSEILIEAVIVDVGSIEITLTVTDLVNGLSGFNIDVFSSNTSTVEIVSGSIDSTNFPLNIVDVISIDQISLSGVDLLNNIGTTTISVELAKVNLEAVNLGMSTISIVTTRIDDNDGFPVITFSDALIIEVESLPCDC